MTDKENKSLQKSQNDRLLNKLIAAAGWLQRSCNQYQKKKGLRMLIAMKEANSAIDEAIEILKES